jgi:hypothetical protein
LGGGTLRIDHLLQFIERSCSFLLKLVSQSLDDYNGRQ